MAVIVHPVEEMRYLEFGGADLYTVLHKVSDPIARVLLIGPFASERHFSYVPWVRWARFLASKRVETLRYDYRGVGESTGVFNTLSFDDWGRDVEFLADWLNNRSPGVPLVLHGLELGALLACHAFSAARGEALLLWGAPANANQVLRAALSRQIATENAFKNVGERKSSSDYLRRLESDGCLEVDGYQWSPRLWRESFTLQLPLGEDSHDAMEWTSARPLTSVTLDIHAAPLVKGSSLAYLFLNPDLSDLFNCGLESILTMISSCPNVNDSRH